MSVTERLGAVALFATLACGAPPTEPFDAGGPRAFAVESIDLNTTLPDSPHAVWRLAAGGGRVFGTLQTTLREQLFVTDGTAGGTRVMGAVAAPSSYGIVSELQVGADGVAYFTTTDGTWGFELWRSDGTEAGTYRLTDCAPGAGDGFPAWPHEVPALAVGAGSAYFACPDLPHRLDLSTGALSRLSPSAAHAISFRAAGGRVYFTAVTPAGGREAFVSDGTEAGTTMLGDLDPGPAGATAHDAGRLLLRREPRRARAARAARRKEASLLERRASRAGAP